MPEISIKISVDEKGHARLDSFELKDFPLQTAPCDDWRYITEKYILPEIKKTTSDASTH
jgi:hypothetical protein